MKVPIENYPFCTIEPNIGVVQVPDLRIEKLTQIFKPQKSIYPVMEFVDIAGLVKGAHKGEGLGQKFLSHIQQCQALLHVVRCFENQNISHVFSNVDPLRDIEIIESELVLADLTTIQNRLQKIQKPAQADKELKKETEALKKIFEFMNKGNLASDYKELKEEKIFIDSLFLLTRKPVLYLCNIDELKNGDHFVRALKDKVGEDKIITISGKWEADIISLSEIEQKEFLKEFNFEKRALDRLIQKAYHLLDLITFFTAGEKEVRAWTVKKGTKAPQAGSVIHSDFEKGFICTEVYTCSDLFHLGSIQSLKEKGLYRLEGKSYIVQDGDVMFFKFNV